MPREFAKFTWRFWHGATGRELKRNYPDAHRLAAYLIGGCRDAHMTGLYMCSVEQMGAEAGLVLDTHADPWSEAHPKQTGSKLQGAYEAISKLIECGFCRYDFDSCFVWVIAAAREQIAATLSGGDKRRVMVLAHLDNIEPDCPALVEEFKAHYCEAFRLSGSKQPRSNAEATPKQPRSVGRSNADARRAGEQESRRAGERETRGAWTLSPFGLPRGMALSDAVISSMQTGPMCPGFSLSKALYSDFMAKARKGPPEKSSTAALVRLVIWVDRLEERGDESVEDCARRMVLFSARAEWAEKSPTSAAWLWGSSDEAKADSRLGDLYARSKGKTPSAYTKANGWEPDTARAGDVHHETGKTPNLGAAILRHLDSDQVRGLGGAA